MKTLTAAILLIGVVALPLESHAAEALKLEREKDHIVAPAIGDGLCVHNLFQSNMVIQRDKPIIVWGWAEPGESVKVAFGDQQLSVAAAADRSWKVELAPLPASSEPRIMTIQGKDRHIKLENILVGDLWVLGGQSNMEFDLARIENGELEIISANLPNIRLVTIPQATGPEEGQSFPSIYQWSGWSKRHFRKGFWDVCSPETVRDMSAIGYVFARRLHMATQVPIGLIDTSRGGTTLETWTPDDVLRTIDTPEAKAFLTSWDAKVAAFNPQSDLEERIAKHQEWVARMQAEDRDADRPAPSDLRAGPSADPNRPGNCYTGMLAPLAGVNVKGAIWHQGYNNCFDGSRGAAIYYQVFPKMIAAWRSAFNDVELPFGILTLCTQGTKQTRENFCSQMTDAGPYVREAQYRTFLDFQQAGDENIGFTVTYDLRRRWYHPQLKVPAGERIARWALATQYGFSKPIRWMPPVVTNVAAREGTLLVSFNVNTAAVDDGGPMEGFAIAGADKKFHPATAQHLVTGKDSRGREKKDMKVVVLTSVMVPEPIHYRYAWARSPLGNIQAHHNTDIPIGTQRSDSWTLMDTFEAYTGQTPEEPGTLSRDERGALGKALHAEDLRRALVEANALLEAQTQ